MEDLITAWGIDCLFLYVDATWIMKEIPSSCIHANVFGVLLIFIWGVLCKSVKKSLIFLCVVISRGNPFLCHSADRVPVLSVIRYVRAYADFIKTRNQLLQGRFCWFTCYALYSTFWLSLSAVSMSVCLIVCPLFGHLFICLLVCLSNRLFAQPFVYLFV